MQRGEIQLIIGPMNAGKSHELLRRIESYANAKQQVLVLLFAENHIRHKKLLEYDGSYVTVTPCENLDSAKHLVHDAKVVAVDMGQFFHDIIEKARQWVSQGKVIIITGLSGNHNMQCYEKIGQLISISDKIDHLRAICAHCGSDASFTKKNTQTEQYEAVCRSCYNGP